ncbi:MAG TPA: glycosyltransferase family 39 protein [Casimicrobiaceae bacterium]|nr:glycosyltransferase family 39 protein [Casimicrobiaceae bacterium]
MRSPGRRALDAAPSAAPDAADPYRAWKQAGLLLLAVAWIALGLTGHDPWKFDDATTFGVAWEMSQRHDYVVPHLAGEVYLRNPPLMPAIAAATQQLLSPPLEPFDAARIAAGGALALILLFTALASGELAGPTCRWPPVLILIGSVGLWDRAHVLSGELGVMAGIAIALYGQALALRRPVAGGAWMGAGTAVAFLSQGFTGPAWIAIAALLLVALGRQFRSRRYAATLGVALVVALALAAPWIVALYLRVPSLLHDWLATESLGTHIAFFGDPSLADPLYHARNLLWFAWPALPLIAWMVWTRARGFNGGLAEPQVLIPAVLALVIYANLLVVPEPRLIQALPLLVPCALLASLEIDSLARSFSAALDWFGILTFGLLAIVVWGIWVDARMNGMSPAIAALFRDTEVGFQPTFHLGSVIAAMFLTLLWIALVRPARRSNRRALLNWAAGVTLAWCLYSTIWLPYLDSRRSYRAMIENLDAHLPVAGCVASRNLGDPQRALLYYFAAMETVREEAQPNADDECRALLVQYGAIAGAPPSLDGWHVEWEGGRRGDATERYVLYMKDDSS